MVQMDAETAVAFARSRSKDVAVGRPGMPQRPVSFHASPVGFNHMSKDIPAVPKVKTVLTCTTTTSTTVSSRAGTWTATGREHTAMDGRKQPGPWVESIPANWQTEARVWSQRRKSMSESLQRANAEREMHGGGGAGAGELDGSGHYGHAANMPQLLQQAY